MIHSENKAADAPKSDNLRDGMSVNSSKNALDESIFEQERHKHASNRLNRMSTHPDEHCGCAFCTAVNAGPALPVVSLNKERVKLIFFLQEIASILKPPRGGQIVLHFLNKCTEHGRNKTERSGKEYYRFSVPVFHNLRRNNLEGRLKPEPTRGETACLSLCAFH